MINIKKKSIIYCELDKIINRRSKEKIIILGVDGPTASGKTIFSKNIREYLESNYNLNVHIFELDWTLKDRKKRLKDLDNLKKYDDIFKYEGELHMDLNIASDFVKSIFSFNQKISRKINKKTINLKLRNLYSRSNDGKLIDERLYTIKPNDVIILEGHYTLNNSIDQYLDYNILLLAEKDTLLKRKIDRVSNYRSEKQTSEYFYKIDLPSFSNHLKKYKSNCSITINNDDYTNPKKMNAKNVDGWIKNINKISIFNFKHNFIKKNISFNSSLYSNSNFIDKNIEKINRYLLKYINILDMEITSSVVNSIKFLKVDLTAKINGVIKKLNKEISKNNMNCYFTTTHSNSLYNVYFRNFPITFGLKLNSKPEQKYLVEFYENKIQVMIIWEGDFISLIYKRNLGGQKTYSYSLWEVNNLLKTNCYDHNKNEITLITPTDFLIPPFISKKINIKPILTGKEQENLSAIECLIQLLNYGYCWISRFPLNEDLDFFSAICDNLGIKNVVIGNYIIAISLNSDEINQDFRIFKQSWIPLLEDFSNQEKDKLKYDKIVKKERRDLTKFIHNNCKSLKVFDTFIFSDDIPSDKNSLKIFLNDIQKLLSSKNRLIRKRSIQFLIKNFGIINLKLQKLFPELNLLNKTISLEKFVDLSPSILAELYLWMTIKNSNSSILAANIYDISKISLDSKGILSTSIMKKVPIVLQSSFNALGHKKKLKDKTYRGYLMTKNGASDLVDAVKNAVIDLVVNKDAEIPLYGIGLDHVDYKNDFPNGRAKQFLDKAIETNYITHMVLDGSALFDAKSHNTSELKKSYKAISKYVGELIGRNEGYYIIDKEICAGELNYIENSNKASIPDVKEIMIFINELKKMFRLNNLSHFLRRPSLFIGNLGTIHHGNDIQKPNTKISEKWVEISKNELFISPVLHGTTNSKNIILKEASKGCKKINVAGNFLNIYIQNLPSQLRKEIYSIGKDQPKKVLHQFRDLILNLDDKSRKIVSNSIEEYTNFLTDLINSPKLTNNDIRYFKYNNYALNRLEIKHILELLKNKIVNYHKIPNNIIYKSSEFCPSLIEVEFNEFYKKIVHKLINLGVRRFHIDVGDAKFITRKIDAKDKVKYLINNYENLQIHCHLMTQNPHMKTGNNLSYIDIYSRVGCTHIAIHKNSTKNQTEFENCILKIKSLKVEPGLVIEVDEEFDEKLISLIFKYKIKWLIIMGVHIGYGGQIFQTKILKKLLLINNFFISKNYKCLLEIDGGLTMENIKNCQIAGADIMSGWSVIKETDETKIERKFNKVKKILEN